MCVCVLCCVLLNKLHLSYLFLPLSVQHKSGTQTATSFFNNMGPFTGGRAAGTRG